MFNELADLFQLSLNGAFSEIGRYLQIGLKRSEREKFSFFFIQVEGNKLAN